MRLTFSLFAFLLAGTAHAQGPVEPLKNLLPRLPAERQGTVVKQICLRGDAKDLAFVFEKCVAPDGFTPEVRAVALAALEEAALTRKVRPAGDLSGLNAFIARGDRTAVRLAGLWQVESTLQTIRDLALADATGSELRQAAIDSLVSFGDQSRPILTELAGEQRPQALRYLAVAGLARLGAEPTAATAARVLAAGTGESDPGPLIGAYLDARGGSAVLAEALEGVEVPADVAKLALRHMVRAGRSDPELSQRLGAAAGIDQAVDLSEAEIRAMVDEVLKEGDPARGELVFRKDYLSCLKCHAVNTAGGDIGPDLRGIGVDSPPDYMIRSIIYPDESIKEQYETVRVTTFDGRFYQGIVADEDTDRLVLKDATGKVITVAQDDIDERDKGDSLMPKGLAALMTHREMVDLVAFLSTLGKPGDYAIDTRPVLRTWRFLKPIPEAAAGSVPDPLTFRDLVLNAEPSAWTPIYSLVSGELPIDEAVPDGRTVAYLRADVEVKSAGTVELLVNSAEGLSLWLGDQPAEMGSLDLGEGRHTLTFRVDPGVRQAATLRVELKPSGGAEAEPVGGP